MLTTDDAREIAPLIETLGDFANLIREMEKRGWTLASIHYVLDQVVWD